jgi:SAM-dependent methyltransferase
VHVQAFDFVARQARGLDPSTVLEIGSLDVNGTTRPLFPDAGRYHGIDVVEGPGVDEVADAADWRSSERFDVVVSTEVLEHAPRWIEILQNAWRATAPGGSLLLTCATTPRQPHSAVDGWAVRDGEWYQNVPVRAVREIVQAWEPAWWCLEVALDRGDLYLRVDRPAR